jgi:hypothetical protein
MMTTAIGAHSDHNGDTVTDWRIFNSKKNQRGSLPEAPTDLPEMDDPSRICGVRSPVWKARGTDAKTAEKNGEASAGLVGTLSFLLLIVDF